MTRYFCDKCDVEITGPRYLDTDQMSCLLATDVMSGALAWRIEVIAIRPQPKCLGEVPRTDLPHFCKHCVLDALYKLDDRPKAVGK